MTAPLPSHTEGVRSLLAQVEADLDAMLKLWFGVHCTAGQPVFPLDFMAFGAVKRNVSTARAFIMMIESWNMVCARSLLRIHIDTSLRFSAAWLVEKPHEFADRVRQGERIDKMKDKDGNLLSDAYLVQVRSAEYPWLPAVYKELSGYVHFSRSHIYSSVANLDEEEKTIMFEASVTDLKFPESSWVEILKCFREATAMLGKFLHGYGLTKRLPPSELAARKAAKHERDRIESLSKRPKSH